MALTTYADRGTTSLAIAKATFKVDLVNIAAIGGPGVLESVRKMRSIDVRYAAAGAEVLSLYQAGEYERALSLHLSAEHTISHEIEDELNLLIAAIGQRVSASAASLASLHRFLLIAVVTFSSLSVLFTLAWSSAVEVHRLLRPEARPRAPADRRFRLRQHVEGANRDEFAPAHRQPEQHERSTFDAVPDLSSLNAGLDKKVHEQLERLQRAEQLRRYLAPQVADAVLEGGATVSLTSTRRNLTILFANIRGFTSLSERMEPEELIDGLNQHFTVMTDVVFRHDGTLDKYIGDGILAFFGDPIPFADPAGRAVATALEMRQGLRSLRSRWTLQGDEELNVGVGISTGYVTVGNIGSTTRTEYTVIGNHVRLAAHLAPIAGPGSDPGLRPDPRRSRGTRASSLDLVGGHLSGGFPPAGQHLRDLRPPCAAPPSPLTIAGPFVHWELTALIAPV